MKSVLPLACALLLPSAVLLQCGGGTTDNDAGTDASLDAAKDTGKDSATDAGKDSAGDATVDGTTDSASDAPVDSPADVVPNDGGSISTISGLVLWLDAAKG